MKKKTPTITLLTFFVASVTVISFNSCNSANSSNVSQSEIDSLRNQINQLTANDATLAKNLASFDTLDYTVFTNQEWTRLHETHAKDIKVYWPDGHMTEGLEKHIEDLKMLFVYAPDTRIRQHPIRFGSGNMTAVTGVFEGTFTKPMPIGNGKFIQPTGKAFKMPMCTIGIWKPDGTMSEEHLFWDNQTYMNQIGLGK
ncbi:MAG TPA: ester cyclase [Chitinophagaceae bacterium]|nr:ester cyclase [Chitinophagaceae bacterium]